ncbi:hypothetical protein ACLM5J_00925 [Nocardioides sp. Bht2]|uniref:hypothetical protein n=1 Tax=Nocardioides sp. Bht2 TaxID=3392297 RepID=UPI0039B62F7F
MSVRVRLVGAATAVALLVGGGAIGSAEAASSGVSTKDLPTLAEVVKVVPAIKGGRTTTQKTKAYYGNTGDCRPEGRRTTIRVGRITSYWAKPSRTGFGSEAHVEVAHFKTKKAARRAMTDYTAWVKNCKESSPELLFLKQQPVPKLGHQRLGFATKYAASDELPARSTSSILVRKGRMVVQVMRWQKGHDVKFKQTVGLVRVAYKRAR